MEKIFVMSYLLKIFYLLMKVVFYILYLEPNVKQSLRVMNMTWRYWLLVRIYKTIILNYLFCQIYVLFTLKGKYPDMKIKQEKREISTDNIFIDKLAILSCIGILSLWHWNRTKIDVTVINLNLQ